MNDIDQKIQAALRGQSGGDSLAADPNLAEEVIVAFRGRNRWLNLLTVTFSLVFTVVLIWAIIGFCEAEAVTAQLRWGGLALLSFLMVSFLKVWFWLEMQSNRLLREIKRVELLLVSRQVGR
jgi:hypothetical protein